MVTDAAAGKLAIVIESLVVPITEAFCTVTLVKPVKPPTSKVEAVAVFAASIGLILRVVTPEVL